MSKSIRIETTQNVYLEYELASIGDRAIAYLIDSLIIYVYLISILLILSQFEIDISYTLWVVILIPFLFYHLVAEIFFEGQTVGKKQMNLRVISASGKQRSVGGFILRWLFRVIDFSIFSPVIALVTASATKNSQRIGDLVGGMVVVNLKASEQAQVRPELPTFYDDYEVTFPNVTSLTDSEINVIERVINSYGTAESKEAVYKLNDKLKELLAVDSELPPLTFLKIIVKDYKHLTS